MPKIEVNGVKLHYEEHGRGNPLILVHGLGGSVFDWVMQVPFFSKTHRVVTVEMRDHGESDKWAEAYRIPVFSSDLAKFTEKLGIDKAVFFGVSMGGMILLQLALDYAERVRALVLADTQPNLGEGTIKVGLEWAEMSQKMTGEEFSKATMQYIFTPRFINSHKQIIDQMNKISDARDPSATFRGAQGMMGFDLRKKLGAINVPTLIANGEDDKLIPLSAAVYIKEHIPGAQLIVLKKGRHMAIIEKATEFNKAALVFLKKLQW